MTKLIKKILRKVYGFYRLVMHPIQLRYGNTIVKRRIPDSELHLFSKRSHVRSNEQEILRMAEYVSSCEGELVMVDVGANIGMVTLLTYLHLKKGTFLCIDGNDEFFPLLHKNMVQVPNSTCENVFLSDQEEQKNIVTKTYVNTASIMEGSSGKTTDFTTLDALCFAKSVNPNFVKIDTDGYDSKILRGFSSHLTQNQNIVLYFEYAPMHQVFNGIEKNPTDIFDFLFNLGYEEYHFYDEQGAFFCSTHHSEQSRMEEITQYCLSSCKLYNVLTFHKNNLKFKQVYTLGEKAHLEESIQGWSEWWAKN